MQTIMALVLITNADRVSSYADAALFWRGCDTSHADIERYGPGAYTLFTEFMLTCGTVATK